MKGKLYGIGVGPGDPELMTLKARHLLKECDIVAVPVKKQGEDSVALRIAKGAVDIPREKLVEFVFPMSKDKTKWEQGHQAAAKELAKLLDAGKTVAMPVLGDVSIYSTYSYVHKLLLKEGYDVQMVPGIPSFCAGACAADTAIAEGEEAFGVIPSVKGMEEVEKCLDVFDNLVIMKAGSYMKEIAGLLKARGMEHCATVIGNVGMAGEYIGPILSDREYGYFTTVIIKNGVS